MKFSSKGRISGDSNAVRGVRQALGIAVRHSLIVGSIERHKV